MNDGRFEGKCACGEVRYRMQSMPLFVHCCHCTWCQRETGASFAFNALIEADRVVLLQGEPVPVATPSNSGKGQRIWRCPTCRVALWSNYAGAGDKIAFVRVGTLDAAREFAPDIHIFEASRQPWVVIPEGATAVPGYYDYKAHWPAASIERVGALFA